MRLGWLIMMAALFVAPSSVLAQKITMSIDVSAAKAVLDAVRNPALDLSSAMRIAALPGNQGLIRKARSYGRVASDASFAQALVAAARQDATFVDASRFRFDNVRRQAAQTERAMISLNDPSLRLIDKVKARIASFTPATLGGEVTGYLVVGGTSGGFAFGDPEFFLNLDRFPSAVLAATIMEHELFHAVHALARAARPPAARPVRCPADTTQATVVAGFFEPLLTEGSASLVGDILALPQQGADDLSVRERARFARNVAMVDRSVTQLELSVHGLTTGATVTPDEVYALGFYGDEVLYALGYVMARAIVAEQGNGAVAELLGQPGAAFVRRYASLKGYGKSDAVPALKPATLRWAATLAGCMPPM